MKNNIAIINELSAQQTPIEVALKIDENGMTTAKVLYEFLEQDPRNYSRWCKDNISNNLMAEKDVDFFFVTDDEKLKNSGFDGRGRPSKDYKLTAKFAKKLAMGTNTKKGDMVKDYFEKVEQTFKQVVQSETAVQLQTSNNLTQLQAMEILFKNAVEQEKRLMEQEETIADIQDDIDYIKSNIDNAVVQVVEEMPVIEKTNEQLILSEIADPSKIKFTTTDVAIAFGMRSSANLNKFLERHGIIIPHPKYNGWRIAERYTVLNLAMEREVKANGSVSVFLYWNEDGAKFLINFLTVKGLKQKKPLKREPLRKQVK